MVNYLVVELQAPPNGQQTASTVGRWHLSTRTQVRDCCAAQTGVSDAAGPALIRSFGYFGVGENAFVCNSRAFERKQLHVVLIDGRPLLEESLVVMLDAHVRFAQ